MTAIGQLDIGRGVGTDSFLVRSALSDTRRARQAIAPARDITGVSAFA